MPELPEVETIRRGLREFILRVKMTRVEVLNAKSFVGEFRPGAVVDLRRRGKALIIDLDNGWSMMVHLRMTGQLVYRGSVMPSSAASAASVLAHRTNKYASLRASALPSASSTLTSPLASDATMKTMFAGGHPSENFVEDLPNRQTRVVMEFENGGVLYFNDQRKFGFIKMIKTSEVEQEEFIAKLAKEPWEMSAEELLAGLLRHKNSAVKSVILDQTVICGLGNIYADESLYLAKIHPLRKAGSITMAEAERLLAAMRESMEKSLEAGGSTLQNYVKADGTRGDYLDLFAKAYGRAGEPCERCGTVMEKIKVAGRGTNFCPKCQRLDQ